MGRTYWNPNLSCGKNLVKERKLPLALNSCLSNAYIHTGLLNLDKEG